MFKKKLFILILLFALTAIVSGCSISFKGSGEVTTDRGIFKSTNKGDTWAQKVLIPSISGSPKNFAGVSVNTLVMDPSDNKAIYYGSQGNGMFYSYDGANNWRIAQSLGPGTINAIAVDYESKCIIYAAISNKVFKSNDCNRTWEEIYFDNNLGVNIKAIAVDHYNGSIIYIGTSGGVIIKSSDRGATWHTIHRLKTDIASLLISPHDSRIIFAATTKKGIHRSRDGGASWKDLADNLKDHKDSRSFKELILSPAQSGLIVLATNSSLLKSEDNGDTWSEIELITGGRNNINSFAMSPENTDEIYYVTNTTFYRSLDGGKTWTTKKLPTTAVGWRLLIDPEDQKILYMGVKSLKK